MRVVFIIQLLPLLIYGRFSNFEAVPAPEYQPIQLRDAIAEDDSAVYSDDKTRLTSVKDVNFHACFITDFDPEWNLDIDEKQNVVDTHEPEIVQSVSEYENLKIRTGDMIANMCKKSKIFWLTEIHSQPLHSVITGNVPPPPIYHPIVPASGGHRPGVPKTHGSVHVHIPRPVPVQTHAQVDVPRPVHVQHHVPAHVPVQHHVPAHVPVQHHVPAHVPVQHHVPAHVPVQHHFPAHVSVQHHVPAHAPAQHHVPAHVPVQHHVPAHVPVQHHVPAHAPVQHHVPAHVPVQHHVPEHVPVQHHVPAHVPVQHHVPLQAPAQHHVPAHAPVPQHVPGHASVPHAHFPQLRGPEDFPKLAVNKVPALAAFHAPARIAVPAHVEEAMPVPKRLPFIRPPLPHPRHIQVPDKRHYTPQKHAAEIVVPQRLSMERPKLVSKP